MGALDSKKTLKILKSKGFMDSITHSKDHEYLEYHLNGKRILHTKISHGSKHDLNNYLIAKMALDCKLTKNQFKNLALCPMRKEDYAAIIEANETLK